MAVGSVTSGTVVSSTSIRGEDSVSAVKRLLQPQEDAAAQAQTAEPYTEQDWYINAKVAQLKGQIYTFSNFPGLDPSGAIMDSLTKEVNDLVSKQQAKMKKSQDEAAKKQAELDALEEAKKNAPLTADQLLERAKKRAAGEPIEEELSDAVKKLLEKSKGAVVDKTV